MPGPSWYATSVFHDTLHIPAGADHGRVAAQVGERVAGVTGQIGGGPWIMSKHSKNLKAAGDFVTWVTTVFNDEQARLPRLRAPGRQLAGDTGQGPLLRLPTRRRRSRKPRHYLAGMEPRHVPDQRVWSNTVVTKLVAGKSLSSLMEPLGTAWHRRPGRWV